MTLFDDSFHPSFPLASGFNSIKPPIAQRSAKIPLHRARKRADKVSRDASSNSTVVMTGDNEFAYLAEIQVGGQSFLLTLDTGSSDLWVASSSCASDCCNGVVLYQNSTSLRALDHQFNLQYLSGSARGVVAYDTVRLGHYQIYTQVFALVNNATSLPLSASGSSGILGLALPRPASIPARNGPTLLENILSTLDDEHKMFGFGAGRGISPGSFTIGTVDSAMVPDTKALQIIPVHMNEDGTYDYWKTPLHSITVNNRTVPVSPSKHVSNAPGDKPIAVFDTGTTLMLGPEEDVDMIYSLSHTARRRSDGKGPSGKGSWELDCTEMLAVKLQFAVDSPTGDVHVRDYWMHPLDVNWDGMRSNDSVWCLGGIQANNGVISGDWLLGDTILRNIYVAHYAASQTAQPRLGLTNLTDGATALDEFIAKRGIPRYNESDFRAIPGLNGTSRNASSNHQSHNAQSRIPLLVVAAIVGFFVGIGGVLFIKLRREKRKLEFYRNAHAKRGYGTKVLGKRGWDRG